MTWQMHCGSALKVLRMLPEASVDCCVTSPPYFGQRDYGSEREQLGRNETLECYVERLVAIFEVMFSILKPGGCLWLNLGDSYCNAKGQAHGVGPKNPARRHGLRVLDRPMKGLKPKDLIGVPWQVAFALRASGWWLRSDTVWHKPNAMPGSQLDRPTSAHEYCFLFSNARRYYFNPDPIREPLSASMLEQMRREYTGLGRKNYGAAGVQNPSDVKRRILGNRSDKQRGHSRRHVGFNDRWDAMTKAEQMTRGSLPRSVWTIPTNGHDGLTLDHFALMPRELARKLVLSACPPAGTVLDPFAGCATTGVVALEEGRSFVGIDLSAKYVEIARARLAGVAPLLSSEVSA